MRISIIGTGYVGLVSGACFAEIGHDCVCVDLDPSKVERINRGETPIHENGLEPMLQRLVGKRLRATTDLRQAVLRLRHHLHCGGHALRWAAHRSHVHSRGGAPDRRGAARRSPRITWSSSRAPWCPGTTDDVVLPVLEEASGKRAGADFGVGMNPEFLTEGVAVDDFMKPDRIVIGGIDARAVDAQREVYKPFAEHADAGHQQQDRRDDQVRLELGARDADLVLQRDGQRV